MKSDQTPVVVTPLEDTWGEDDRADVLWYISSSFDFSNLSTSEINCWFSKNLRNTLHTFSGLIRVWEVEIMTSYTRTDETLPIINTWNTSIPNEDFINQTVEIIQQYPAPIYELNAKTDLFAYIRTQESPSQPIRIWTRYFAELSILGRIETGRAGYSFKLLASFFWAFSPNHGDNRELYSLNQPLLAHSLKQWEKNFGSINFDAPTKGVYEYGFLPNQSDYGW